MKPVVIENPILNSPFEEPRKHFKFNDEGITDDVVEGRRPSSYFVPIATPKKKGKQLTLDNLWTKDRAKENDDVNFIRGRVVLWRGRGYPDTTPVTRTLLEYWTRPDRERRLFFCQIEALETLIYLTEAVGKSGDAGLLPRLKEAASTSGTTLFRLAFKMATGSGKTAVMAMLIAWHTLNRLAYPSSGRFADALTDGGLYYVRFIDDFPAYPINNSWIDTVVAGFATDKVYVVQTNPKIVERCLLMTTDPGDLVLDPTCGSGTTAYLAEQWGRRWITIDTSRVALALARTRLMAAKFPYYLLADSPEGRKKEADTRGASEPLTAGSPCLNDIRRGFVYKQVPHVTLKSIANNPDIKEGMTREQIDAAIRKHADTEILYDQPYSDNDVVRVAGPFTVESLFPHRMLPSGDEAATGLVPGMDVPQSPDNYLTIILDNLRKAGVQNTVKNERLVFERLDIFPSAYVQAEGTFAENGMSKGVRVSIGPEFGTVGPEWIKCAAMEAMKGSACDLLLVCGFAFDPHVHEQTQELKKEIRFGKLPILAVRMNPDLAMGDELLKKTGSGNLFMVFGEPDIALHKQKDGKLVVEVRGVDVYDPTTGEVRSHSTDDIVCWFIDSDYNGESFFVRHAYFCGKDEPYEKLKKALRAEIDEAEWAKLYSTRSLPFDAPIKGKIAVKVINHYGDEVLQVYRAP
jgi:adenine-specific DNA-methyltransferase